MAAALEGIKVLDVGQLVQGSQAAATLSDMGAGVTKVELPGIGDPGDDAGYVWYFPALLAGSALQMFPLARGMRFSSQWKSRSTCSWCRYRSNVIRAWVQ